MKRIRIVIFIIFGLIVITNLPPIKLLLGADDCKYCNKTGTFTFQEMNFGGYDYGLCKNRFAEYKRQRGIDTILYRATSMNPLCFWKYGDYLFEQKYRLPYMSWKEVELIRGPIRNKSGFQDF